MGFPVFLKKTNLRQRRALEMGLVIVIYFAAFAGASDTKERWEYRYYLPDTAVCSNANNALVDGLNKLGAEGWEVISFSPAGSESRATMVDRDQNNARTSLSQSVAQYATIQSRITGCPLLLKRRIAEVSKQEAPKEEKH